MSTYPGRISSIELARLFYLFILIGIDYDMYVWDFANTILVYEVKKIAHLCII